MKTLYINTVTRETTIALYEGNEVVSEIRWPSEHNEAEKLQPSVEALLKQENINIDDVRRIVVCVGPGGFTSSRIGISAVNTWSFAKKLPIAQVSVFDLYRDPEAIIIVSSNSNEGWVQFPGKVPEFQRLDELKTPEQFSFGGLLDDHWKSGLEKRGGSFLQLSEELPKLDGLEFQSELAKPWYYKDANITWSKKHESVRRLNTDR